MIPDWLAALTVAAFAVGWALTTGGPLAVVGWLRADRHRFWNGLWFGTWGVALSAAIMAGCLLLHLGWLMTMLDCAVLWTLAWFLLPSERRARLQYGRAARPQPMPYAVPHPMPQPTPYPMPQPMPQVAPQQFHAQQYAGWPR